MLELKEIQRSLPRATQPFDDPDLPELDARGIPRTHFLKNVPVALVPLIGPATSPTLQAASPPSVVFSSKLQSSPCHSPPSRPPPSPPSTPPPRIVVSNPPRQKTSNPPTPPSPPSRTTEPWVPPPPPPRLPYNIPIQPRPLPRFNFVPLLETPAPPVFNPTSQPCQPPPLCASPPLPASQDLPQTTQDRTPSPHDEKPESSFVSRSCHNAQPTKPFSSSPSIGSTTTAPGLSLGATAPDRPSNLLAAQLLPPSPRSSPSSPSNMKDASSEDSTHLGAELARLWHGHSCSTDGETEAEESEAESSVVHTEADSDGESAHARAVVASSGPTKVVRTPVAVATAADTGDDEEGEMSLVELENGVIAFVRTPRRR